MPSTAMIYSPGAIRAAGLSAGHSRCNKGGGGFFEVMLDLVGDVFICGAAIGEHAEAATKLPPE